MPEPVGGRGQGPGFGPAARTGTEPDPGPTLLYLDGGPSVASGGTVVRRAPAGAPARRQVVINLDELTDPAALRAVGRGAVVWLVAVLIGGALIAYLVGPLFALHTQRTLTQQLQLQVDEAYGAAHDSLTGATPVTRATPVGGPVAIIQIPRLALQQAVAEGAGSGVLRGGAGHVPGTAGPGQPGGSVLVARRHAFGGPFAHLDRLVPGDPVIVLTPQGKSLYRVQSVESVAVRDTLYDPVPANRMILLSSSGIWPLNSGRALMVTAGLEGKPFVPTPQNGFATDQDGRHGDGSAWALVVLEALALAGTIVAALFLYRRWSAAATYLITTPALLALMIVLTLTGTRLLPGWF